MKVNKIMDGHNEFLFMENRDIKINVTEWLGRNVNWKEMNENFKL